MADKQTPDHDPETGEVREEGASDGSPSLPPHMAEQPPTYENFAQFVYALEDGDLNAHLTNELKRIAKELTAYAANYGGKPKAKIDLALNFVLDSGAFTITPKVKVETPQPPRGNTMVWVTGDGRMTPLNPKQFEMFKDRKPRAV